MGRCRTALQETLAMLELAARRVTASARQLIRQTIGVARAALSPTCAYLRSYLRRLPFEGRARRWQATVRRLSWHPYGRKRLLEVTPSAAARRRQGTIRRPKRFTRSRNAPVRALHRRPCGEHGQGLTQGLDRPAERRSARRLARSRPLRSVQDLPVASELTRSATTSLLHHRQAAAHP